MMERDAHLALTDPAGLAKRVANSRYKDFAQAWTDATAKVVAAIARPKPSGLRRGVVVYQDRLRDENHEKDDTISYAVGTVLGEDGNDLGAVIVAFDMARTNDAVRMKYLKFAGICSFFIALILVQNIVSRRNRLRLLDLEATYATAKRALRDAMPGADVRSGDLVASGSIDQASGPIDGMVWVPPTRGARCSSWSSIRTAKGSTPHRWGCTSCGASPSGAARGPVRRWTRSSPRSASLRARSR